MPWVKGKSGNPNGRPKYSAKELIDAQVKKRKKNLIEEIFECIDNIPEELKFQRLPHLFKLMEFMYSKPREIDIPLEMAIEVIKEAIARREAARAVEGVGDTEVKQLSD